MRETVEKSLSSINRRYELVFIDRDYSEFESFPDFFYESPMLYVRLLTAAYVEEPKYIYLDSDLLICGDISRLFATPISGCAIAGCVDESVKTLRNDCPEYLNYGFDGNAPSYNSGVLLIDRTAVQAEGLFDRAISHLRDKPEECELHDQSAINFACYGRWHTLDQRWNKMINHLDGSDLISEQTEPHVVHFVTNFKPWLFYSDRIGFRVYREYFKRYGSRKGLLRVAKSLLIWRAKSVLRAVSPKRRDHRRSPGSPPIDSSVAERVRKLYQADTSRSARAHAVSRHRAHISRSMGNGRPH